MTDDPLELARSISKLNEWAQEVAPPEKSEATRRIEEHFGEDPSEFPTTGMSLPAHERPNLQIALDACLSAPGREAELIGPGQNAFGGGGFSGMFVRFPGHPVGPSGSVDHVVVQLDRENTLSCVRNGLYLVRDGDVPLAVLVSPGEDHFGRGAPISVALLSRDRDRERAEALVAELRTTMRERNVYRGKVVSISHQGDHMGDGGGMTVTFHDVPYTDREEIVLAEGVLERIDRNTIVFAENADRLRAAGRHLRRGVLLHGPPGTGKTLTGRYLASQLPGRTVLLLTGNGLGMVGQASQLARELAPSMMVLEDIDLIAADRMMDYGSTPLLFELLNEMDGMDDDVDVIFLLTTNRPDLLEPALAARPGRVDLAIEMTLPDPPARKRLLELFCRGMDVDLRDVGAIVARTDEASPAFLRELARKAALIAAEADLDVVTDAHFAQALDELEEGGRLTKSILGSGPPPGTPGGPAHPGAEEWGEETGGFSEDRDEDE